MMKNKELSNIVPRGLEEPENMNEEFAIEVEDDFSLTTGEHFGRIASFVVFTSKNAVRYGKFTIGTAKKYGDKNIVHEVERVYYADYHAGSELVKLFNSIGCMNGGKLYPERVTNVAVKFTVTENSEVASAHKFLISEIVPVKKIPEECDFRYVKRFNGISYEYHPVTLNAEEESVSDKGTKKNFKEILNSISEEEVDFG